MLAPRPALAVEQGKAWPEALLASRSAALDARTLSQLGLIAVLTLAGILETWAVTISGYGNGYYAEAAQAASASWTALLTNAADPSGVESVDKGPLSGWVMGLSGHAFGFHELTVLLPNVLYALASVALLHDLVRRVFGRRTALLAALMLAVSPVSVVIGRYDNPDGLLALLLLASAWSLLRSLESRRLRDLVLSGTLVGLAFNTKMLEAYLIVPALAVSYMLAARGTIGRRTRDLMRGGLAMLLVSGAWYLTMTAVPASARPAVAESPGNSWLQLIVEGNGLQRLTGAPGQHGRTGGPLRLFSGEVAGQASWLLPLALLGLLAGVWLRRGSPRTDRRRAALVLLGLWLLAGYVLLSFPRGVFHSYYTGVIAPPIAALAAIAVVTLGERIRTSRTAALALAGSLLGTAALSWAILGDAPRFLPTLRWVVLASAVSGVALLARSRATSLGLAMPARGFVLATLTTLLAGPTAYSVATLGFGRTGASPTAGPAALTSPHGTVGSGPPPGLVSYLTSHRGRSHYIVAATGSDFAAPLGLATRAPIVTLGGFTGNDPTPSVAQLHSLVRSGELRYVLLELPSRSQASRQRDRWVRSNCTRVESTEAEQPFIGENGASGTGDSRLYRCVASDRR